MHKKKLGCISMTGLLAALLTLLVISGVGIAQGGNQFSPGTLNNQVSSQTIGGVHSHAETGGNCAACHSQPWSRQSMSDRCVACHSELTSNPKDFHKVMLAQSRLSPCYNCHTDHRGPNGSLTVINLTKFPHLNVGFSLAAHQRMRDGSDFTCKDCHSAGFTRFDPMVCESCHTQIDPAFMQAHAQAYGADCRACHDGVDRFGHSFDHSQFPFKLAGKHTNVDCAGCHSGVRALADFQSAKTGCSDCHAKDDAHQGKFGADCAGCHTPQDWKKATFDHSKADFQLTGAHANVACEKCHVNNVFKGTPQDCAACHAKDDAHQGKFGTDCGGCHTPDDWKKASFDHSKAAFQLTGAHANVECTKCHVNNVFKGTPQQCVACHGDPPFHAGLFPTDCAACHTTQAWSPAQFNQAHSFPLNHGEGGGGACQTCHPSSLQTYTCYGCHEHNPDQIAARHLEEGIRDFADCIRCHPTGRGGD
jgi:hypothetical protein